MSELTDYVREALRAGVSKQDAAAALAQAGWQEDEVARSLDAYADVQSPVPVPRPRRSGSAREAFLYLATFTMLYTSSIALGVILIALVSYFFPDPVFSPYDSARYQFETILASLASLIVSFPIYFFMAKSHVRNYATDPDLRASGVRRWLTYMTLFVAFIVIVGGVITVLYSALTGELAVRFVLKAVVVLGIAAAVYTFYRWELKVAEGEARP